MKKLYSEKLWERVGCLFLSLLVILYAGYGVAMDNAATINDALGLTRNSSSTSADGENVYYSSDYDTTEELEAYLKEVGMELEGEGMVLLKNDNDALPLAEGEKISCFLTGSVNFNYSSSGSSAASTGGYPTLQDALTESGFEVNETLWSFYTEGDGSSYGRTTMGNTYLINEAGWDVYTDDVISSISDYGTAIVTISRDSGEGKDISTTNSDGTDGSYLSISAEEQEVLEQLTAMKEEGTVSKIIVLLNSSSTIQLDFLDWDGIDVDACLWVGNVGSSGIYAIGQVLSGEVNPSGRLSDTYVKDNFSSPAMANWMQNTYSSFSQKYTNADEYELNSTQENYAVYTEGIYVGYRYYETRYEDYVMETDGVGDYDYEETVAYPFGYGLSYTEFEYSDFTVTESDDGETFEIQVTVTNTGDVAGKEVVEVYLQKPYTEYDQETGVEKASAELAGFAKTSELEAGTSETVTITVEKEDFKSYDSYGYETYILEEGSYYLTAASDAHEAVNNFLTAKGYTSDNTDGKMDADGDEGMVYEWVNDELDTTTYSVSSQTGEEITNQFNDSDVNLYEGSGDNSVTYVSRSDWTGTWPSEAVSLSIATEQMAEDIQSNQDLPEDDDAEMPTYGADNGLTLASLRSTDEEEIAYDDERWDLLLDQMTYEEQSTLLTSAQMNTAAIESVGKPATAEDDGPTGVSSTTTSTSLPSEGIWASTYNTELMEMAGDALAEDSLAAGLTGLYACGVNIHRTPFDGRSHEYFSEDPTLTGIAAMYEIRGMQAKGVITVVKHLAFNEEETNRNGVGIWLNEQEAREIMLTPFEYALSPEYGNAHAVMTSFNRAGTTWTGASENLLQNVIHDEWGFDGYNITDMASSNGAYYMTFQDGIMNGTDCFLGSGGADSLSEFKDNASYAQRMREATHRILYVVANFSAAMNGLGAEDTVTVTNPWWQTSLQVALAVAGALSAVCVAMYIVSWSKKKKPVTVNKKDE